MLYHARLYIFYLSVKGKRKLLDDYLKWFSFLRERKRDGSERRLQEIALGEFILDLDWDDIISGLKVRRDRVPIYFIYLISSHLIFSFPPYPKPLTPNPIYNL